jgi:hypothetical protein
MTTNNSSSFMSTSNLILININITDIKRHMLVCLFIFMLVGNERDEIIIKIKDSYQDRNEVVIRKEVK